MSIKNKRKYRLDQTAQINTNKSRRQTWVVIAIALYITFLLLSTIAFTADRSINAKMEDSYEYHLTYPRDGRQTHYYVERVNTSRIGKIDLVYTTASNSLVVKTENIKVLHIYCRSMYEDECREVFGFDPSDNSNYYKWYFIEKNHLNVNIESDYGFKELSFIDTPIPYKVEVNGEEWIEDQDYFYTNQYSIALSHVPAGSTNVDIYFKPRDGTPPTAFLSASETIVPVNHSIIFDCTQSTDPDGVITRYILDFGDGTFDTKNRSIHSFSEIGICGVILTVRDNDDLVDHAYVNISVVESSDIPRIVGVVPDQAKPEDSPPWSLNLSEYEPIPNNQKIEFYWFLTGENTSLYSIAGENSTNDQLIFTPITDAYGSDQVTLWLQSTENLTVSQQLWINITPVNDPPIILSIPDLILHYDDPYTFNYLPYVDDKETPNELLILSIYDGFEENYITINGLNATYNYPQALVGETIYATVTITDGEAFAQDMISIQVTTDYVPKLVKELPDIWLYEGTTKYNVFDLDDYFTDPDNDAIYFSYGQSHLDITININHTVDITAASEWTGSELVTFRARDPIGALAEDLIIVTVIPINDPPIIKGVPDFFIHYGHNYRFDLTPYIHDNDNLTTELSIIPSDITHIHLDTYNNMIIIMNYPIEFQGQTKPVRLTVTDGIDFGFQDVNVTITDDFPPELITPLPDVIFLEDEPLINAFDLDYYFLDIDGDVLYYTSGNKYVNITISPDNSVDFSAPKDWFGEEIVYFRATDPTGALQQDLVRVTVLPINDPPILLPLPPQHCNESMQWVVNLEPYMFDVDNNISELEITVNNDLIVVSGTKIIFFGTEKIPKEVEVTINDGQFSASQIMEIHIKLAKRPHIPTVWELMIDILPFLIIIILIFIIIAGTVYRKKIKFVAEEVFLIHHGGTLITHLTRNPQANIDDVIFSGMFTAVQDFIKDTFTSGAEQDDDLSEDNWALDELKLGDNKILIERSKHTFLAVIFSGEGSKRLRKIVIKLLDKIEKKYEKILPNWDGNINVLAETKEILSVLINVEDLPELSSEQKLPAQPATPPTKQLQPTLRKTQLESPSRVITSTSLRTVQPIKLPKKGLKKKGLLEFVSEQSGAGKPALAAWPMRNKRFKTLSNKELIRLPMALHIKPHRQLPKTIVIKKSQISLEKDTKADALPSDLDISNRNKTIKIPIRGHSKTFKLDTSRSIFEQLAEFDDED